MKYIIDIDKGNPFTDGQNNKLYKAKGFASLVFDQIGLDKLEFYKGITKEEYDQALEKGYAACLVDIENAKDLLKEMPESLRERWFGYKSAELCCLNCHSEDIIGITKEWKEDRDKTPEINVGDIVEYSENTFVVTRVLPYGETFTLDLLCTDGAAYYDVVPSEVRKLDQPNVAAQLQALLIQIKGDET